MSWYSGDPVYDTLIAGALILSVITFIVCWFWPSPYGRFARKYGLNLGPRLGWFLMELPAPLSFLYFFFKGPNSGALVPRLFLLVWLVHYGNRAFFFPFSMRAPKGASFSLVVV